MPKQQNSNTEKCHAAIKEVCQKAVPCIKKNIRSWQQKNQPTLGNCTGMGTCPITGGKPRAGKGSCASCVRWGQSLEAEIYPLGGQIQWSNINPTLLSTDPFEVAKAFVLRLKARKTYSTFGDLDSASLLMIMMGFKEFHQGDPTSYGEIKKVSDIRNTLSHFSVDSNRYVSNAKRDGYFNGIGDLVACLQRLHPSYFMADVVNELNQDISNIQTLPQPDRPSTTWNQRVLAVGGLLSVFVGAAAIFVAVWGYCGFISCNHGKCVNLIPHLVPDYKCQCDPGYHTNGSYDCEINPLDVKLCRRQLRQHYLQVLCKIPRLPGDREMLEMDTIYTNLSIERQIAEAFLLASIKLPINSHNEIFTIQVNRMLPSRILVLGRAGSGKSTLIAKVAYDWAHGTADFPLKDIPLLFALNMRWMKENTTLEDAILYQLLPKDTTVTKESLVQYIESNPSAVVVLLDSYDEFSRGEHLTRGAERLTSTTAGKLYIHNIMAYNRLTSCRVLITSRHWRESDFNDLQNIYVKFEVTGFSTDSVKKHVMTYFRESKESGEKLCTYIESHDLFGISASPLMTQMLCLFWKYDEGKTIPRNIGDLYTAIFDILYKHNHVKGTVWQHKNELNELMIHLGKVAFLGLWPPENRLVFSLQEVKNITSNQYLELGCKLGIISIENDRTMLTLQEFYQNSEDDKAVLFFHKTGQEKCAGEYLSHLATTDPGELLVKLRQLNTMKKHLSVQMILRFACGRSEVAARYIIQRLTKISDDGTDLLTDFYEDKLTELSDALLVQEYVELCLICNFESRSEGHFNSMMLKVFPIQMIKFVGMSPYTGMAISHFLTWIGDKTAIDRIIINTLPQHGALHKYIGHSRVTDQLNKRFEQILNSKSETEIENLFTEYVNKNADKFELTEFNEAVGSLYSIGLTYILLWEYFETWQAYGTIDLCPILKAVKYISLRELDLSIVNLQVHGETLISIMEQGHLSFLTHLSRPQTHLDTQQLTHIGRILPQSTPKLQLLDISNNKVHSPFMRQLSESLSALALQVLQMNNMGASAEDMTIFARRIPEFCSDLLELRIRSNHMNDASGLALMETLPYAKELRYISVDVRGISRMVGVGVLETIRDLTQLHTLVIASDYPEEIILSMAHVVEYLPMLGTLWVNTLPSIMASPPSVISHSSWKLFMTSLQTNAPQLAALALLYIRLHETDLQDLVDLCRKRDIYLIRHMWPEGMDIPTDIRLIFFKTETEFEKFDLPSYREIELLRC